MAEDAGDRAAGLEAAWAARVRGNREQVERVREVSDGPDFYRPTSVMFRADPFRTGDAVLDALLAQARPDDTWLDIGAGAGRFALPLALRVARVIALDPSAAMQAGLREGMAAAGISNVEVIEGRWPDDAGSLRASVALIAHVGYDVEAIGPFLAAMESAASRACVAVMMEQPPAGIAYPFWPPVHGEERVALPALPELVELLEARGRTVTVQRIPGEARHWHSADDLLVGLRQQLWVEPDSAKGRRLADLVAAIPREPDGSIRLESPHRDIGIVAWAPSTPG
jgi:SAM-dependent methyltransferase